MSDTICLWIGRVFVVSSTIAGLTYALGRVAFWVYKNFIEWNELVEFFAWKRSIKKAGAK